MDIKKIIKKKQKKQELENKIIRLANAMGYTKGSQISQTRFISDSTYTCSRGYEYKVVTILIDLTLKDPIFMTIILLLWITYLRDVNFTYRN